MYVIAFPELKRSPKAAEACACSQGLEMFQVITCKAERSRTEQILKVYSSLDPKPPEP